MKSLIKALQIFLKYSTSEYPTHCEHDVMYVCVNPSIVSAEDIVELESLGFHVDLEASHFYSYRFGNG